MYPVDAITITRILNGPQTIQVLPSGSRTLLSISMQQSGTASETYLRCGADNVATNYGKDFPQVQMMYKCNNTVEFSKTGQDSSSVILTYVDRDIAIGSSTMVYETVNLSTADRESMYGSMLVIYAFMCMVLLYIGIKLALYMFRK